MFNFESMFTFQSIFQFYFVNFIPFVVCLIVPIFLYQVDQVRKYLCLFQKSIVLLPQLFLYFRLKPNLPPLAAFELLFSMVLESSS